MLVYEVGLNSVLIGMTSRRFTPEFIKRTVFTILLILAALTVMYSGPIVIMLSLIALQAKCFSEIINIGYSVNKLPGLPNFRLISWYLLTAANIFFVGEHLATHFDVYIKKFYISDALFTHHRFIAFCMYLSGIVWFVLSVVRKHRLGQYKILAWTHILLKIVVLQSYLIIQNMFTGMIWIILPIFLVVVNDTFAYIFGKFLGSRPLIKVSPKKTWEGYIGGAISTVIFGIVASYFMCESRYFVCPIEYVQADDGVKMSTDCSYLDDSFHLQVYSLKMFNLWDLKIYTYPFVLHSLALSLFASIIAPFGGFFASGFKRSLKIKDFSDTIPGHGGLMDRFDCQFLMGSFVNVYIFTFLRSKKLEKLFHRILSLDEKNQIELYHLLKKSLESNRAL